MTATADILEQLKGFGGYTTTASLWTIAGITWWRGLPGFIKVVNDVIDAIGNRQSKIEERMSARLKEADERFDKAVRGYEAMIQSANERHEECIQGQFTLQRTVDDLRKCVSEQQDTIAGFKRQLGQVGISMLRADTHRVPAEIQDMAVRAALALDSVDTEK